jgi:hypothetical protein
MPPLEKLALTCSWALAFLNCGRADPPPKVSGVSLVELPERSEDSRPAATGSTDTKKVCRDLNLAEVHELHDAINEPGSTCATLLRLWGQGFPNGCVATLLGGGSTVFVYSETECGADSCSGRAWVASTKSCGVVELPVSSGTFEASPNGDFVLVDYPILGDDEMSATGPVIDFSLSRIDLPSLERSEFAPCMSAQLSPGKQWFLCRNRDADVLKVPLTGGAPQVVVRSGATGVRWVPYAYGYPGSVTFPAPDQLEYSVESDEFRTHTIEWKE